MQKNGFTLIELLVVVVIIAIIAAIALPQYQKAVEKSRVSQAMITTKAIAEAAERYFLTYATWPVNFSDLDIAIGTNCTGDPCTIEQYTYRLALASSQGVISAYRGPAVSDAYFTLGFIIKPQTMSGAKMGRGDIVCVPRSSEKDKKLCEALGGVTMHPGSGSFFTSSPFYILGR